MPSMECREYLPEDRAALEALHEAQGFDYALPALDNERIWITRQVVLDSNGVPVQAVLGRLTSEVYFLGDPTSCSRMTAGRRLLALEAIATAAAQRAGIIDTSAWLAPDIAKKFGRQLGARGWRENLWPSFTKILGG